MYYGKKSTIIILNRNLYPCCRLPYYHQRQMYIFFLEQFSQKREYNQHQSYDDRLICIPLANR